MPRGKPFEQREQGHRNLAGTFLDLLGRRRAFREHGLGQPDAHIVLAAGLERAQTVDRHPRGGGDQPRFEVADERLFGAVQAQPYVLHDVFGVGDGTQHAVCNALQPGTQSLENGVDVVHGNKGPRRAGAGQRDIEFATGHASQPSDFRRSGLARLHGIGSPSVQHGVRVRCMRRVFFTVPGASSTIRVRHMRKSRLALRMPCTGRAG